MPVTDKTLSEDTAASTLNKNGRSRRAPGRAVNYGSASGPAALSKDGGSGEAATGSNTSGQFRGQRPDDGVSGGGGGRERGGLPTAGRRDGDAARGPTEGAGDTARGAHRLLGALLREHGPTLASQRRRRGAPRPAPPAAAAPGPRAVAPSPGSPLAEVRTDGGRGARTTAPDRPRAGSTYRWRGAYPGVVVCPLSRGLVRLELCGIRIAVPGMLRVDFGSCERGVYWELWSW